MKADQQQRSFLDKMTPPSGQQPGRIVRTIGDIPVTIVPPDEIRAEGLEGTAIQVHTGDTPEFSISEAVFDSGTSWALMRNESKMILRNSNLRSSYPPNRVLLLDRDLKKGDLFLSGDAIHDPDPLGYPLNQVLMIMLLSQERGLLLHACGICDREMGYLFLGNSGHGKSTMAKFWHERGARVLNDDRIVVREKDGDFWVYGTPWHGDFKECSSEGQPLDKLFFLSRGQGNMVTPKRGAEAVSMLLTRSFPPLWDKEGMGFTMDLCHRLAERVPCCELSFVPNEHIVDFVRSI